MKRIGVVYDEPKKAEKPAETTKPADDKPKAEKPAQTKAGKK
jgi:hypothetical protein